MFKWELTTEQRSFLYRVKEFLLYFDKMLEQHGLIKERNIPLIEDNHLHKAKEEILLRIHFLDNEISEIKSQIKNFAVTWGLALYSAIISTLCFVTLVYLAFFK